MRRALPSSQELPGVLELHLLLPGDRAGVRATALNAGKAWILEPSGREILERRTYTGPGLGLLPSRGHEPLAAQ